MKKTKIIIKSTELGEFLNQMDSTPSLELLEKDDLQDQLKKFSVHITEHNFKDLNQENLKDLIDKLHALPDDELQETLKTYPKVREIWYQHFAEWTFGEKS